VLATARKDFDPATFDPAADLLPLIADLELLALVGIVDPPHPTAKDSIATAKAAGIRVQMITGDHAVTVGAIARQLGIDGTVITGTELPHLDDAELLARLRRLHVFGRVAPEDKLRPALLMQESGEVVAMLDTTSLTGGEWGTVLGLSLIAPAIVGVDKAIQLRRQRSPRVAISQEAKPVAEARA
jgi:Ca2+-transporting ATPase